MKVNVIDTGSKANLYELVDREGNSMLIEAGSPVDRYMKCKIGEKQPEMMIISHKHADHNAFAKHWSAFIKVHFMPEQAVSDSWKVMGFDVAHGDCPCKAFIIQSEVEKVKILFATDLMYDDDKIWSVIEACYLLDVENYLLECNYNGYLYHLASEEQRIGCDRHFSDNDIIRFIRKTGVKRARIITIHGSNRLCADTYTKRYIEGKLPIATVMVAVGEKKKVKNVFLIS